MKDSKVYLKTSQKNIVNSLW